MKKVYEICGKDFYITIDTGHQSGQRKFLRPDGTKLKELLEIYGKGGRIDNLWLGPKSAYEAFHNAAGASSPEFDRAVGQIEEEMDKYPYLFAADEDGDPYAWLEALGCYSPIIHLQQTDGSSSSHKPFIPECNRTGIISGDRVLKAIKASYEGEKEEGMPRACESIHLTLEIFSGTADINEDILYKLRESVKYWRKYIPEDGLTLSELAGRL